MVVNTLYINSAASLRNDACVIAADATICPMVYQCSSFGSNLGVAVYDL